MQIYGGYNTCQRGTLSFQRVASDAIDPMVQVDNGSAEVAALTTGTPLDTGAQETDDTIITEFDGLWESNDKPWHGTIEIERKSDG